MFGSRALLRASPILRRAAVRHNTSDAMDDPKVKSNMRKYGLMAAPFVMAGASSSIICMSETVRDFVEEYFPSYGESLFDFGC